MLSRKEYSRRVTAVILGAGQGTRMGYHINKVFLPVLGKPIIVYAIETFEHCSSVDEVILVAAAGEEKQMAQIVHHASCKKVSHIVRGGATRHESEFCALELLRPSIDAGNIEIVLIHDGARPFISVEKVEQLIRKTRESDGAILAVPLEEEERIAQVDSTHLVQRSFERQQAWKAQTPQAFQASFLLRAYDQAQRDQFYGFDTAASVERFGGRVAIVQGDAVNLKITTAEDLLLAERLSSFRRF